MWSPCVSGAAYIAAIDWAGDGDYTDPYDDVTADVLDRSIEITYGRDQHRQLAPPMIGTQSYALCNLQRIYSPENSGSPLFGDIEPARPVRTTAELGGTTYGLFAGRIDDFEVHVDRSDRSVEFTMLDGLAVLAGVKLSTDVLQMQRTGTIIDYILDQVGWTAPRDLDPGATHVPWWWAEGVDAFDAVKDLVLSEGPPAIAYVAPDGTFVFRDRHHRLLRDESTQPQARFSAAMVDCEAPPVTGFDVTDPFVYQHGWSDIVNSVTFSVEERAPDPGYSVVWSTDTPITISSGETIAVDVETTDPFVDAQTLTLADVTWNTNILGAYFSRLSGQSMKIFLTALSGDTVVTYLQLRARSVPVGRTIKVSAMDTESIAVHGERTYSGEAPWAGVHDAGAIASLILGYYSSRRPTVQMRVTSCDPEHLEQILTRTISDRIIIQHDELGLDGDFLIEQVSHTIRRINQDDVGQGPVHAVVLGCERALVDVGGVNVFTFDKVGSGFDQGVFGTQGIDDPTQIFIFDDPTQGQFDLGRFAT